MKRLAFIACVALCAGLLGFRAGALTYTDDMTDTDNNSFKSYSNLVPVSATNVPQSVQSAIPGGNALSFASGVPVGAADYRVSGADTVTVDIYTARGTFISIEPVTRLYVLGYFQQNMSHLSSQQVTQALYSRSEGGIYANLNGRPHRLIEIFPFLQFQEAASIPGDLIDYGVNVYAGDGDGNWSRIALSMSSQARISAMTFDWSRVYCNEKLTYHVPSGAVRVRVEINDYTYLSSRQPNGQVVQMPPANGMRTVLSQVAFTGGNLVLGTAEPAESVSAAHASSASASQSSSAKSSSSSRRSSSGNAGAAGDTPSAAASGASSGTSKFTGTITSSASGGRASGAKSGDTPAGPEASSGASSQKEEVDSAGEEPSRVQVFRLEPDAGSRQSTGILLYIIVVCAAIVLLLLRGKG